MAYHPVPLYFSSFSDFFGCGSTRAFNISLNSASAAWPSSNLAIYHPFFIPWKYPIKRMFWVNGGTAGGNVDVGIYSWQGTRLLSIGSTAQGTASVTAYATVDYVLPPGSYYYGTVFSATTGACYTLGTSLTAIVLQMQGCLQEALGSTTLPATMTPAAITGTVVPLVGFTSHATY